MSRMYFFLLPIKKAKEKAAGVYVCHQCTQPSLKAIGIHYPLPFNSLSNVSSSSGINRALCIQDVGVIVCACLCSRVNVDFKHDS